MKRLISTLLCGLLFCSCGLLWEGTPSYVGMWGYKNTTNIELTICMEVTGLNEQGKVCNELSENTIPKGEELWSIFESHDREDLNFHTHFLCLEETLTCKIWLINSCGEILKEWIMDVDNGEHDIFDERNWTYENLGGGMDKDNFPYKCSWTFTITDEDIGVVE